ncbi:MAG: non-canonical purine NTP pyrophosphatase [Anaerolineales bacterium]
MEGSCEGEIIPEERGTGGFGYDPIFLFPDLGKTMSELGMEEKNRLSHRAKGGDEGERFLISISNLKNYQGLRNPQIQGTVATD